MELTDIQVNTIGERVKYLRETLGLKQSEFAERIETDPSSLSQMENGRRAVGTRIAFAMEKEFGVSRKWLTNNEGEMFIENIVKEVETKYQYKKQSQHIPYYEIDVSASKLTLFSESNHEVPSAYLDIPFLEDCDFAVKIYGDSMYPKFRTGDIILCKEVNSWKDYVVFGEVYLIVTTEHRLVKYVRKSSKEGYLRMVSENDQFDDFDVPVNDILKVYIVKGKIQRNTI